jgi:hypothetical protein
MDITDPAMAEASSFRGLLVRPPYIHPKPFGPFRVELPGDWTLVNTRGRAPYAPTFRVPAKDGKGEPGWFSIGASVGDSWVNQLSGAKAAVEKFEGPATVTVMEATGTYTCDPSTSRPRENWRVLVATVRKDKALKNFRLEGPVDSVGAWRGAFVEMLRKAETP